MTRQVTEQIRFFAQRGTLRLDWSGWLNLLAEGAKATAKHANPLTLPFPELELGRGAVGVLRATWRSPRSAPRGLMRERK